jgi:hypothetical protein
MSAAAAAYYVHAWVQAIGLTLATWLVIELAYNTYLFCRRGMDRVRRLNEREGK